MQITIAGHQRAVEILEIEPNQIDVIFISSPDSVYAVEGSNKIEGLARDCCTLLFNDVTIPKAKMSPVKTEDIQRALDFAKGKERVLICCQAGISRSSAIAFLVAVQEFGVEKAFEILNPAIHIPNNLVVRYGSVIVGEPGIVNLMACWKANRHGRQSI